MGFPKIIHQIWFQGVDKLKDEHIDNMESIKRNHPIWTHKLWDEQSMFDIVRKDTQLLRIWKKLPYMIQKIDFFKYVILYKEGGIYIDMDMFNLKPIDPLLKVLSDYEIIVGEPNFDYLSKMVICGSSQCCNNGIIVSQKGSSILMELIDLIDRKTEIECNKGKFFCTLTLTGPYIFANHIKGKRRVKILDLEYFDPCTKSKCEFTVNSYFIDKHDQSWMENKSKIKPETIYQYVKGNIFVFFLIIVIVILLIKRKWLCSNFCRI